MTFSGPFFKQGRNAKSRKKDKRIEDDYRAWIAPFALCVKCLAPAVDLCHVRPHGQGYMKPEPEKTVPMCRSCHTAQEVDREFFAPLSVDEVHKLSKPIFNAWAIAQDADLWLSLVHDLHMRLDPVDYGLGDVVGSAMMGDV